MHCNMNSEVPIPNRLASSLTYLVFLITAGVIICQDNSDSQDHTDLDQYYIVRSLTEYPTP